MSTDSQSSFPDRLAAEWRAEPAPVQAIQRRMLQVVPAIAGPLRPNASFVASGGDSLDLVEMLCAMESDYGVRLTTDDLAHVQTVREFYQIVAARATKRPHPSAP